MEQDKKIVIYICAFFAFLFTLTFIYNNVSTNETNDKRRMSDEEERRQTEEIIRKKKEEANKQENNQNNNQENETQENNDDEEQKKREEKRQELERKREEEKYREYIKQEELKEKEIFKEKNLISKLSKYNFKEVQDDKCLSDQRCFENNDYYAYISNGFVNFDIKVTKDEVLKYDCTKDLEMFKDIFEKDNFPKLSSKINYFIRIFPKEGLSSMNFKFNRLSIYMSYYGSDLHYRISRGINIDDNYEIDYVDSIIDKQPVNINLINERKTDLYNFLIDDNKSSFFYYDYFYNYFNEAILDVCSIVIEGKDDYIINSSFCHGGTSNTYLEIEKKGYPNEEPFSVKIDFKGDYFIKNFVNVISNDLKYFSNKNGMTYELSDENKTKLTEFINSKSTSIDLVINDSMSINITYKPDNYYKDYYVKYIIK